jgi:acetyl esterase/lipase
MAKLILQGKWKHKCRSLAVLVALSNIVWWKRLFGRGLVRDWTHLFETANVFWREQFTHALRQKQIEEGRAYFDSLVPLVEVKESVERLPAAPHEPAGEWFLPRRPSVDATILYFHGGGYAFYAETSKRFIALQAHAIGCPVFALDYRLTPEHPHPAQLDDAIGAYRFLLARGVDPARLVVGGDSAGGHLMLMMLAHLKRLDLPQPALGYGLSPWTDIGERGRSFFGNDRYDMVQGYMALRFGDWLRGNERHTAEALSPVHLDFTGTAPVYLQAGGREILVDMIRDFARIINKQGARVRLEVWPEMTHEFQAYGDDLPESAESLAHVSDAIRWAVGGQLGDDRFARTPRVEVDSF